MGLDDSGSGGCGESGGPSPSASALRLASTDRATREDERIVPAPDELPSTRRLARTVLSSIFVVEALIMALLSAMPEMPGPVEWILDALLLSVVATPIIYLLVFRPMRRLLRERNAAAKRQALVVDLLDLLNRSTELTETVADILHRVKSFTDADAVAIRLRHGRGFPYFVTEGFPVEFVATESALCTDDGLDGCVCEGEAPTVLRCMCGNVLCGQTDPSLPFFSAHGSFWTNSTTELLASAAAGGRHVRDCDRCHREGYESVALIPLRSQEEVVGLLQLNDRRPGRFSLTMIRFFENIGTSIGIALRRQHTQEELRRNAELLRSVGDAQSRYFDEGEAAGAFRSLLRVLVDITESESGFIDEVRHDPDGEIYKRSLAISDISWDDDSRRLYQELVSSDLEFRSLDNLAGIPAKTGELVIANDPANDPRSKGVPPGHPEITSFMGIPMYFGGELLGVAGVANRVGGYSRDMAAFLEPFTNTCAGLIRAVRNHQKERGFVAAIQESKQKYQRLFESANDAIFLADAETCLILEANQKAADMLGTPADAVVGMHQSQIHPDDEAERYTQLLRAHVGDGGGTISGLWVERRDGHRTPVEVSTNFLDLDGKRAMLGIFRDTTERLQAETRKQELEAHLRRAQKLESIGTLAGGVAHEINNPINGAMNYAQLIVDRLDDSDPLAVYAREIIRETERVATIVRNLLAFARQQSEPPHLEDMADIVETTLSLIRTVLRHDQIELKLDVPDDLPPIKCQRQHIQQMLMNIVTNSRDALNERYEKHDESKVIHITARTLDMDGHAWLRTTVTDYGVGISEDVGERVFDPFFTTKGRDRGAGIGLSISHSIVLDHQGRLHFESTQGSYTRFHIDLPAAD